MLEREKMFSRQSKEVSKTNSRHVEHKCVNHQRNLNQSIFQDFVMKEPNSNALMTHTDGIMSF